MRPAVELYSLQRVARPAAAVPARADAPIVVAGFFSTASGVGEGARSTWRALKAVGLSPLAVDLSERFAQVDHRSSIPLHPMPSDPDGTLILQVNAQESLSALLSLGMDRRRNWYTIGYWAWELPTFPKGWERAFPLVSEIWGVSNFASNAFRLGPSPPPVSVFGHGITVPHDIPIDRARFGLPEDAFVFLTFADSKSSLERKNPIAAIETHKRAFGDDPNSILVLKTRNLNGSPKANDRLKKAIAGAENIRLMDGSMSGEERWKLMSSVDSLISLHRSEGFGLTIAEAMALGRAVVTTNWSGNMDFCNEERVWLVDSHLVDTDDPYGVYSDYQSQWAQVDVDHAVERVREVRGDAAKRAQKIQLARDTIAQHWNPKKLGESMSSHLFGC
ncbi:MAG: glycosyltransferase family 4 protein [Pseudomonadota bacterium]